MCLSLFGGVFTAVKGAGTVLRPWQLHVATSSKPIFPLLDICVLLSTYLTTIDLTRNGSESK